MTEQAYLNSDLVFRVSGGARDGELLAISTRKCMLGIEAWTDRADQPSCAIFRGPAGATIRNYADQILINGESKSTHWLVDGDQIEFPNSISLFVNQLGCIPAEYTAPENHSIETTLNSQFDLDTATERLEAQLKLDRLEFQVSEIAHQNQQVTGRFNELDQRLTQLTEQLSTLVTLASNGQVVVSTAKESSEPNVQPFRRTEEAVGDQANVVESIAQLPTTKYSAGSSIAKPKSTYQDPTIANEWASIEAWSRPPAVDRFSQDPVAENLTGHPAPASFDEQGDQPDATGGENPEPPELTDEEVESDYRSREIAELFRSSLPDTSITAIDAENATNVQPQFQHQTLADFQTDAPFIESVSDLHNVDGQPADQNFREATDIQKQTEMPVESVELFASEPPAPAKSESVAEILARMKSEGQWGGVGDDDEPVEATLSHKTDPPPPKPEEHSHSIQRPSMPTEQEDVEDYMSQLLSRMRGGQEPSAQTSKATDQPVSKVESVAAVAVPATGPMTLEEFIPKTKAAKLQSLDAMRDIANASARTAVASSEEDRRKALAYVQLAIAVGSGIMSMYYFFALCKSLGDTHFVIGLICLGLSGFLGFRFYTTMNTKTDSTNLIK